MTSHAVGTSPDIIDPIDSGEGYLGFGRPMPLGVEDAHFRLRERRVNMLRGWALSFRHRTGVEGALPPWFEDLGDDEHRTEARKAMRYIAAGFAIFADPDEATPRFTSRDWALLSGLPASEPKQTHRNAFVARVEQYLATQVRQYEEVGTGGISRKNGGDYDFVLRDAIALIHTFVDHPTLLTNDMVWNLISHRQITFTEPDGVVGEVPVSGQELHRWLYADDKDGWAHWFVDTSADPALRVGVSTPETENHLLLIWTWRYLVNEYIEWVTTLPVHHARRDGRIIALATHDPQRYVNAPQTRDWVLQLLGRIPRAGTFEANARPYHSITTLAAFAFYQGASALFPDDADRQRVTTAARNALDYLAAEFTFESLEGKRVAPSRRQYKKAATLSLYASDYLANMFGILTGAYVFDDTNGSSDLPTGDPAWVPCRPGTFNEPCWALPYHWNNLDENGGYALWALLSGYEVPRPVHHFMIAKHAGYLARINTRYTGNTYGLNLTFAQPVFAGDPSAPDPAPPMYFQPVANGEVPPDQHDIGDGGMFMPVTQVYFATGAYLNTAGGHNTGYYPWLTDSIPDWVEGLLPDSVDETIHSYDVLSRPSTLMPRGNIQLRETPYSGSLPLTQTMPAMLGQGQYWASRNLNTYKSLSLGYFFTGHDDDRHEQFPQHYPEHWNDAIAHDFGVGRAYFRVHDFTDRPDHPLHGHYWLVGRFSKSENDGLFRSYARGLWEVVPGHMYPDAVALGDHVQATNPASNFNDVTNDNYLYRMATTGETVQIDKLMGSSKTEQGILRIWDADGVEVPVNRHIADVRDREELRLLPLVDVWQVDRDHRFTGDKYAHADGRGRVTVHNPFLGETLVLDSSIHAAPAREVRPAGHWQVDLPPIPGNTGPIAAALAVAADDHRLYVTQGRSAELWTPATQPGELVVLDRRTLGDGSFDLVGRVQLGRTPHRMAHDPARQRLYVADYADVTVTVIDTAALTVLATHPYSGFALSGIAVSSRHRRVFIAQPGQDRIHVLQDDLPAAPVTGVKVVAEVVVDDATDRLYLLVEHATNPQWYDLVEYEITPDGQHETRRVTVDAQASVPAGIAVDAHHVYVLNGLSISQKVTVIDRATFIHRGPLRLPQMGLAVAASTSQRVLYVATSSKLLTFDAERLQHLRTTDAPPVVKAALAVHDPSGRPYLGGSGNYSVASLRTPEQPPLGA